MKQTKVSDYRPNYPKKALRTAILTTATAVALTGTIGCDLIRSIGDDSLRLGGVAEPVPTDELVLDGEVAYDDPLRLGGVDMPAPTDELVLVGEATIDETGLFTVGEQQEEEPALMGKIIASYETETP